MFKKYGVIIKNVIRNLSVGGMGFVCLSSQALVGTENWSLPSGGNIGSTPAYYAEDERLYIGSADGAIQAVSADGQLYWRYTTNGPISGSPTLSNDGEFLYVSSQDQNVYAIESATGKIVWQFHSGEKLLVAPTLVNNDTLYIANEAGRIQALNASTGEALWHYDVNSEIGSSIAVDYFGHLYFGTADGYLYSLDTNDFLSDPQNATERWRHSLGGAVASPAVGLDGNIYVGTHNNTFHALTNNGDALWSVNLGGRVVTSPAIGFDGTLYVASYDDGAVNAIRRHGQLLWTLPLGASSTQMYSSITYADNQLLYVGAFDGTVYEIDPELYDPNNISAMLTGSVTVGSAVVASPIFDDEGNLYVNSLNNKLYSFTTDAQGLAKSAWPNFAFDEKNSNIQNSIDSDGDGVGDEQDKFPRDYTASVDRDNDGYPDAWHQGFTESDSPTGLTLDHYTNDAECYLLLHGDGTNCDYSATMPEFIPDQSFSDNQAVLYILSAEHYRIYRWSTSSQNYLKPIVAGLEQDGSQLAPQQMTFNELQNRIYLRYANGVVTYVNLAEPFNEQEYIRVNAPILSVEAVGQYMLVRSGNKVENLRSVYDSNGNLTDSRGWDAQQASELLEASQEVYACTPSEENPDRDGDRVADVCDFYPDDYARFKKKSLDLRTLNGVNGFTILQPEGDRDGGHSNSIAVIGDLNGDGYKDYILEKAAGRTEGYPINQYDVAAYIVFGNENINLRNPRVEFDDFETVELGKYSIDQIYGVVVNHIGDINNDGYDDVGISISNESHIIFGHGQEWPNEIDLDSLDGNTGFSLQITAGGFASYIVGSAGDLNADGMGDIYISVRRVGISGVRDRRFVMFGHQGTYPSLVDPSLFNGMDGVEFANPPSDIAPDLYRLGTHAGYDINQDGVDDLIINYGAYEFGAQRSFVVYGHKGTWPSVQSLSNLHEESEGVELSLRKPIGDINGDGFVDYARGLDEHYPSKPNLRVEFGSVESWNTDISIIGQSNSPGFYVNYSPGSGHTDDFIEALGDVNGDGFDDFSVFNVDERQSLYVIFGQAGLWPEYFFFEHISGENGFKLDLTEFYYRPFYTDYYVGGLSISNAFADINNDGLNDILVDPVHGASALLVVFGCNYTDSPCQNNLYDTDADGIPNEEDIDDDNDGISDIEEENLETSPLAWDTDADGASDFNDLFPDRIYWIMDTNNDGSADYYDNDDDGDGRRDEDDFFPKNRLDWSDWDGDGIGDYSDEDDDNDGVLDILEFALGTYPLVDDSDADGIIDGLDSHPMDTDNDGIDNIADDDDDNDGFLDINDFFPLDNTQHARTEINLMDVDGNDGFSISTGNESRGSDNVSRIGDINGDGIDDLLVTEGVPYDVFNNRTPYQVRNYVVFGQENHSNIHIDLQTLDGTNGFVVLSPVMTFRYSNYAGEVGDFNGDGLNDIALAFRDDFSVNAQIYILYGSNNSWEASIDLVTLDQSRRQIIFSNDTEMELGAYFKPLGDVNNDGFHDIGAVSYLSGANDALVIYGRAHEGDALYDITDIDGTNGFTIHGIPMTSGEYFSDAFSLYDSGDFNGDGLIDLLLGDSNATSSHLYLAGEAYILWGQASWPAEIQLASLNAESGVIFHGSREERKYGTIKNIGDFNHDGVDDLSIGKGRSGGDSYIIWGHSGMWDASYDLADFSEHWGLIVSDAAQVSGIGDINGDNIDDVAFHSMTNSGFVAGDKREGYVVFGSQSAFPATIQLSELNGTQGFALKNHKHDYQGFDSSVIRPFGDFNNDGLNDILMATEGDEHLNPVNKRVYYIVYGCNYSESLCQMTSNDADGDGISDGIDRDNDNDGVHDYELNSLGGGPILDISPFDPFQWSDTDEDGVGDYYDTDDDNDGLSDEEEIALGTHYYLADTDGDGVNDIEDAYPTDPLQWTNDTTDTDADGINNSDDLDDDGDGVLDADDAFALDGSEWADVDNDGIGDNADTDHDNDGLSNAQEIEFGTDPLLADSDNDGVIDGSDANPFDTDNDGINNTEDTDDDGDGVPDINDFFPMDPEKSTRENLDIRKLNGANGFYFDGTAEDGQTGNSVSRVGDFNGDGIDDFIIGAYKVTHTMRTESGVAYLVFGRENGMPAHNDLSSLNGVNGFVIESGFRGYAANRDRVGFDVSAAGDVNGDGFADLLVSSYRSSVGSGEDQIQRVHVIYGARGVWNSTFYLNELDGVNGFTVLGYDTNFAGFAQSVSDLGDINNDGFDDFIIGADMEWRSSVAYGPTVIFGGGDTQPARINIADINGENGFHIIAPSNISGLTTISSAGDINADGIDDILVAIESQNRVYIIFGDSNAWSTSIDVANLNGENGFVLTGASGEFWTGLAGDSLGDVNGDGLDDLVVVANQGPSGELDDIAKAYVIFGRNSSWPSSLSLSSLDAGTGLVISKEYANSATPLAAGAGDINGDGLGDILFGIRRSTSSIAEQKSVSVIYGKLGGWNTPITLSEIDAEDGFSISGTDQNFVLSDMASAGDLNGDGYSDIVVSNKLAEINALDEVGRIYVIYGCDEGENPCINPDEFNSELSSPISDIYEPAYFQNWSNVSNDIFYDLVNQQTGRLEGAGVAAYIDESFGGEFYPSHNGSYIIANDASALITWWGNNSLVIARFNGTQTIVEQLDENLQVLASQSYSGQALSLETTNAGVIILLSQDNGFVPALFVPIESTPSIGQSSLNLSVIADQSFEVGNPVSIEISASDVEGRLHLVASNLPTGLRIQEYSLAGLTRSAANNSGGSGAVILLSDILQNYQQRGGLISGIVSEVGTFNSVIAANDDGGGQVELPVQWTIVDEVSTEQISAIHLRSMTDKNITVGENITIPVVFTGALGEVQLNVSNLPEGLALSEYDFGVFSDDAALESALIPDINSNTVVWGDNAEVNATMLPVEGANAIRWQFDPLNSDFGTEISALSAMDMDAFIGGQLIFSVHIPSDVPFQVGVYDELGNSAWIEFPAGEDRYGLDRQLSSAQWQQVSIPINDFIQSTATANVGEINLSLLRGLFTFQNLSNNVPANAFDVGIDDVRWRVDAIRGAASTEGNYASSITATDSDNTLDTLYVNWHVAADTQEWIHCADEYEICSVPAVREVRFGASGEYIYAQESQDFQCLGQIFAVQADGLARSCAYRLVAAEENPLSLIHVLPQAVYLNQPVVLPTYVENAQGTASFEATDLPAGLEIDSQTGLISGQPTVTGQFNSMITVSDDNGQDSIVIAWSITNGAEDGDGDGVLDGVDLCLNTESGASVDANGCSEAQLDDDGDGVNNSVDLCASTPEGLVVDSNGCAAIERDTDSDGIYDAFDLCPSTVEGDAVDSEGCSAEQRDTDGDTVNDSIDQCPNTPSGQSVDAQGCSAVQRDSDNDGFNDVIDLCPNSPEGEPVNSNGCALSELDTDLDGVNDALDQCPDTPLTETANAEGCSFSQLDDDGDGVNNPLDICPNTPEGAVVDAQGCPIDSDGDGVFDGIDQCPNSVPGTIINPDGCATALPLVSISQPLNNAVYTGANIIDLVATADDPELGDVTSTIVWTSSADGEIASGGSTNTTGLSVGTHTITATATDPLGAEGSASVQITVNNSAPTLTIQSPENNAFFEEGEVITFTALAEDIEDGDISANVQWASDRDGALEQGASINFSTLTAGNHTITANVQDSEGEPAEEVSISITVLTAGGNFALTQTMDIGNFAVPGALDYASATGIYTIDTDAHDISSWADNFFYVYENMSGDIDLRARIVSISNSGAKTGLMIRSSTEAGSAHVSSMLERDSSAFGLYRPVAPGNSFYSSSSVPWPEASWVRIQKVGDTITTYASSDGSNWTQTYSETLVLGETYLVGLASTTNNAGTITRLVVDNLSTVGEGGGDAIPVVDITSPVSGTSFTLGEEITFTGTASDLEDSSVTADSIVWTTSMGAPLGSGASVAVSSLPVGSHIVIATATDNMNQDGTDQVTIIVEEFVDQIPVVDITAPAEGSSFTLGEPITLTGTASDLEDPGVTASSIVWTTSTGAPLGMGASIDVSTLALGSHTIIATATDNASQDGTDEVTITVAEVVDALPVVEITAPANGASFTVGTQITFTGTASDVEDPSVTADSIVWTTSLGAPLGTGASINVSTLTVGTHTIIATATDNMNQDGADQLTVTINAAGGGGDLVFTQNLDIGTPATASALTYDAGTYTIDTVTFDIASWVDEFFYVYEEMSGDFDVQVHVVSISSPYAKTGLMVRGSTEPSSAHMSMMLERDSMAFSIYRLEEPSNSSYSSTSLPSSGVNWLRLQKVGSEVVSYASADGSVWTEIERQTLSLGSTFLLGIASVTTESRGQTQFVLDQLSTLGGGSDALPVVDITAPSGGASFTEGEQITFTGTASDAEDASVTADSIVWTTSTGAPLGSGASINVSTLSVGTHTIVATVTDDASQDGTDQVTITVTAPVNQPPVVAITAPADGATFAQGAQITFTGTASDAEDSSVTADSIVWTTSTGSPLGSGASVNVSTLAAGTHTIVATATDNMSQDGTDQITVTIDAAPVVSITSPTEGTTFAEGALINLTGTASDAEDSLVTADTIVWTTSAGAPLGEGASVNVSSLPVGTHTLVATVTDTMLQNGTDQVTITVDAAPSVSITSPLEGANFTEGDQVTFTGTASDPEDSAVTADSIVWTTSTSIPLGTGASVDVSSLAIGTHTIVATVTDNIGQDGTDQVTVTVTADAIPVVDITAPSEGSNFTEGDEITFSGTASDLEDSTVTAASIVWTTSTGSALGSGASINVSTLPVGTHTIVATATDDAGQDGTDQVTISVVADAIPVVDITAPSEGSNFTEGDEITFSGTASDLEDSTVNAASIVWTTSTGSALGSGASINVSTLPVGTHTIVATATDDAGQDGTDQVTISVVADAIPVVDITAPSEGGSFTEGDEITFSGTASDLEDSTVTAASIVWTTSTGSALGSGASINISSLSVGTHTIVATATDGVGQDGTDQVTITVTEAVDELPVVDIIGPSEGTSFTEGDQITFSGTASDLEDSSVTAASIVWTTSTGSPLGQGASISVSSLPVGTHTIVATATDNAGQDGTDQVTITVNASGGDLVFSQTLDIGSPATASALAYEESTGTYTIDTVTFDIASWVDQFFYIYEEMSGDFDVRMHVVSISVPYAKTGLMVRNNTEAGSAHMSVMLEQQTMAFSIYRLDQPANSSYSASSLPWDEVSWLRLQKVGSEVVSYGSSDGENWTEIERQTLALGENFLLGIASVSTESRGLTQIVVDQLSNVGGAGSDAAPVVNIASPLENASFTLGEQITLSGTASDAEDVSVTADSIVWTTSTGTPLGQGASINVSTLPVGTHTIIATVTDNMGQDGTDQVTITVAELVDELPVVNITGPAEGASFTLGELVTFSGTASDAEDSSVTADSIVWTTSTGTPLGQGASIDVSTLPVGTHTIVATATDNASQDGVDQISISIAEVVDEEPVVSITSPADGASFTVGEQITFIGTASDLEDSSVTDASIVWTTSTGTPLGQGASVAVTTLPAGTHTIVATATDNMSQDGTDQISITVNAVGGGGDLVLSQSLDLGSPATASALVHDAGAGSYTIDTVTFDISSWVDEFFYVYEEMSGDFDIRVNVLSISTPYAKTGLMVRDNTEQGSVHMSIMLEQNSMAFSIFRLEQPSGSSYSSTSVSSADTSWLRLQKVGSEVVSYASGDGEAWTEIERQTLPLGSSFWFGIASVSNESRGQTQFVLDQLSNVGGGGQ